MKAARDAAVKRWKAGLERYKNLVRGKKDQIKRTETKVEKAIGAGVSFSIAEQARADVATAKGIKTASRGVKAVTAEETIEDAASTAAALIEQADETLYKRT